MALNFLRQKQIFDQFGNQVSDDQSDDSSDDSSPMSDESETPPQIPGWSPPDISDEYGGNPSENMGGGITPIPKTPNIPDYSATAGSTSPTPTGADDITRWSKLYENLYKPSTSATDRLNALLDQTPTSDQYKPGILRTIGALGVGMGPGGLKAANEVMDEPYASALEKWKAKTAPFQQAAQLENTENVNARQVASSTAANILGSEKLAETTAKDQAKAATDATRAKAYAFSKDNPSWKFDFSGPNIIAVSPDGTQRQNLGPTGHLDDATKYNIQGNYKVAAAQASGAAAATVAGIKGRIPVQDKDGNWYLIDPSDTAGGPKPMGNAPSTPTGPLAKPGTTPAPKPGDVPKDIQNTLENLYHTDPLGEKWIQQDPDSLKYSMKPKPVVSSGLFGFGATPQSDLDEWNNVNSKVYGPTTGGATGARTPTPSPSPAPTPTPAVGAMSPNDQMAGVANGTRLVAIDPQGNQVTIKNTQASIQEATMKGYKVQVK